MSHRIFGLETELGCLIQADTDISPETIAAAVRDAIFTDLNLGILDIHYRDWNEPPGNGGFLFNGGRLYIDMGHLEYATPECCSIFETIVYDRALEPMLLQALEVLGLRDQVSFIKNNIDHHTGATFGCHENYLVRRNVSFQRVLVPALMAFFVTRQIFAGAGRVGSNDLFLEDEDDRFVGFQISQRADHIVTGVYEWVQFSRAIINARDEPLADHRRYRRLHLLVGDSNMCEYAAALKLGTTRLLLDVLERNPRVEFPFIVDPVSAIRQISRDPTLQTPLLLETGEIITPIEVQRLYLEQVERHLRHPDKEAMWILDEWNHVLDALERDPNSLIGKVDWVTKRWLLDSFRRAERLTWDDPWLESLDLEYHNLNPERGLYFSLEQDQTVERVCTDDQIIRAIDWAPNDTRARARSRLMRPLAQRNIPCLIDWDMVYFVQDHPFEMPDPFDTYDEDVARLLKLIRSGQLFEHRPSQKRSRRRSMD